MKKLLLISTILLVVCSVNTFAWNIEEFYGIKWEKQIQEEKVELIETQTCFEEPMFQKYINYWNQDEGIIDVFNAFEDGYYVMDLTKETYLDSKYYTAYKWDGKIEWIKKGICTTDNEYTLWSTDIDVAEKEQILYTKWKQHDLDAFDEGYSILRQIEGITTLQKAKLIIRGTQLLAKRTLWPVEDINEAAI